MVNHTYSLLKGYSLMFLKGLGGSLYLTFGALAISFCLALVITLIRVQNEFSGRFRFLNCLVGGCVTLIRGTPALLQLLVMAYVVLIRVKHAGTVAIITFGLNSAAYVSEILRAGVNGINKGQYEAAITLGLGSDQALRFIIMPQVLKNSIPALLNEFSGLLKETALAGSLGVLDLTQAAMRLRASTFQAFTPLVVAGALYLGVTFVVGRLIRQAELMVKRRATRRNQENVERAMQNMSVNG
ncbi:MAG: amino acid ABC transporter permease [Oscillospiraceae bacterium]|jgi:His/Glu/Gln/Arg/opine family amino acid ABC transporter permease subunit|nr:amino acid ABC transporter permease [Oscillospiraceae bacterium]